MQSKNGLKMSGIKTDGINSGGGPSSVSAKKS